MSPGFLRWAPALLLVCGLHGGVLVQSTFDSGKDGWKNLDLFSLGTVTGSDLNINRSATGGNPGGYIWAYDRNTTNAFGAPSQFLGNKSEAFRGRLQFDMKAQVSDVFDVPLVVIGSRNGSRYVYVQHSGPPNAWTRFSVPLRMDPGWRVWNTSGAAATDAQIRDTLADLQYLRLFADFAGTPGDDTVGLDNVRLYSHSPEPSTASAVGAFLLAAALLLAARRYRILLGGDYRKTLNAPEGAIRVAARDRK